MAVAQFLNQKEKEMTPEVMERIEEVITKLVPLPLPLPKYKRYFERKEVEIKSALTEIARIVDEEYRGIGEWQIETILRNNSVVEKGHLLVLREDKFTSVIKEIKSYIPKKQEDICPYCSVAREILKFKPTGKEKNEN